MKISSQPSVIWSIWASQDVRLNALKKFFENNNKIESFVFVRNGLKRFQLESLQLLPNLQRLYLSEGFECLNLGVLSILKGLKKLKLERYGFNVNKILTKLTSLQELELYGINIDENTFFTLKSFHKLQLLVVRPFIEYTNFIPHIMEWNSSFSLPTNIKHDKLEIIEISTYQIVSIIGQLQSLENIQLKNCRIVDRNKVQIKDFAKVAQLISNLLDSDDKSKNVKAILADSIYCSEVIQFHKVSKSQLILRFIGNYHRRPFKNFRTRSEKLRCSWNQVIKIVQDSILYSYSYNNNLVSMSGNLLLIISKIWLCRLVVV